MKGDRLYLTHILDAVEKIGSYISVGQDVFASTSHWQDAVIRQLEIIGEQPKDYRSNFVPNILKSHGAASPGYAMC